MKRTIKAVTLELQSIGMTIRKRDGEYRVNFRGGEEATAAYDTDLDAVRDTALAMWGERFRSVNPQRCAWFAMCSNTAIGTLHHPKLGNTLICERCATNLQCRDIVQPLEAK